MDLAEIYLDQHVVTQLSQRHMRRMDGFTFSSSAELFIGKGRNMRRFPVSYKRFDSAAEAVRFGVEELPPASLAATILEVDERRFGEEQIRGLYDRPDYPLPRRTWP